MLRSHCDGRWDNKGLTFRYMAQRESATAEQMEKSDSMLTQITMSTAPQRRSALWERSDTADIIFVGASELFEGNKH